MSFLKKIITTYKKPLTVFAFAVSLFSIASVIFAAGAVRPPVLTGAPDEGNVYGFAWMGTGIDNPNISEGGGGWLKFNCEPDFCGSTRRPWGVKLDFSRPSIYGTLTGNAWSNNYGYLSFDPVRVKSCWETTPSSPKFVARAINLDNYDPALGQTRKFIGWAKFIAGDDVADDGWDGCVSFSGADYGVEVDIATGDLTGWAWGSDVVGWISFKNPECPFCDTSVNLPGTASINFWADDETVAEGGSTRLNWEAFNSPAKSVVACDTYSNTSNYRHWMSEGGDGTNIGTISTGVGNLPEGRHDISGINQTTTYRLTCRTSDGQTLPTKFATINVISDIKGCMDPVATNYNPAATTPSECFYASIPGCMIPAADNYNPLATVDDGSCMLGLDIFGCTDPAAINYNPMATVNAGNCTYAPGAIPNLNLNVFASSFTVGSGSYNSGLINWTSNNNPLISSCTGSFLVNGVVQNLPGWTGSRAVPNNSIANINMSSVAGSATAGTILRFRLTCQSNNGTTIPQAEDTIIMTDPITPPNPAPIVNLTLLTPPPAGDIQVLPDTGYVVQIGWRIENATSCQGTSQMIVNNFEDTNALWNGSTFTNTSLSTMDMDMVVGSSLYSYPTTFTLTCVNEDGVSATDSARVLIDERPCPPQFLPTCGPIPGSNIPGYEEF